MEAVVTELPLDEEINLMIKHAHRRRTFENLTAEAQEKVMNTLRYRIQACRRLGIKQNEAIALEVVNDAERGVFVDTDDDLLKPDGTRIRAGKVGRQGGGKFGSLFKALTGRNSLTPVDKLFTGGGTNTGIRKQARKIPRK